MGKRIVKYNPAFLSKKDLIKTFVVRHAELELIVQVLRENVTDSNQHFLVIGPRGIGKTMLCLRTVEEVRKEKDLNEHWYPLVFAEESYQVTTPGEFWLEALFHLGQKAEDPRWKQTYKELRSEQNEEHLRERALAQLMDFADSQNKRILLVVENFNMLLGEQMSDKDGWALRHTLLHESRIMLLATATSRFEQIDNVDKPMFDLFRTLELKPLEEVECRTLWTSITGKEPTDDRVRPIQILTGGNPRLLSIISGFASRLSLKDLMSDLMRLVDEHTEYFKSHLDGLPPTERKVYLGLAELWDPSTARGVADATRLNVNKTSSLLRRLIERGAVVLVDDGKRTKLYQVAERMYNIYYLMRRRGAPSWRVRALVNFLVAFYDEKELVEFAKKVAEEACSLETSLRLDHYYAFEGIVQKVPSQELRDLIINSVPKDFLHMPDTTDSIKRIAEIMDIKNALSLFRQQVKELDNTTNDKQKTEDLCRKAIEAAPDTPLGWVIKGGFLGILEQNDEAETAFRKALELDEKFALAWFDLGLLQHTILGRYDEAEEAYRKAIELEPNIGATWTHYGLLLHEKLERYEEAENAYRKAIEFYEKLKRNEEVEREYYMFIKADKSTARIWTNLGRLLSEKLERYEEAEEAYRKAIELDENSAWTWANLGCLLHEKLDRYEEAETAYHKAIELDEKNVWAWANLGCLLYEKLKHYEEAEKVYRRVIELDPTAGIWVWLTLGSLYIVKNKQYDKAEEAFREAMKFDDARPAAMVSLAFLFLSQDNKSDQAFEILKDYLTEPKHIERSVSFAIESLIQLAASGYEQKVLELVLKSPSVKLLEPLVVGLRMYLGEDIKVAAEIMEVAKDVVKRIEKRRDETQSEAREKQDQQ